MSITRIQNNQITDTTIVGYAKINPGTLTGNLFNQNLTLNSNVTINGNLFLSNTGNTLTINATNTYINDPQVVFNNGYSGSLSGYDIGILVNRNLSAMAPYGSVNTFWGWVENDQAFEAWATTATGNYGSGNTNINNSGYANVKLGNTTIVSGTVSSTLTVSGNTVVNNTLYAQGVYDNSNRVASFSGGAGNLSLNSGNITLPLSGPGNLSVGGSATSIPVITTDAYGRILSMSNTAVSTTVTLAGTSGTGTFAGGGTLTFASTNGVTIGVGTSYANISTPQDIRISATPTFNGIYSNVGATSLFLNGNAITSNTGLINLGSISNLQVTGGASGYTVTTNGTGTLNFNAANAVVLGANAAGQLVSPAVTLTSGTNVTDAIAQLNQILGKLTPAGPPNFPGNVASTVGAASTFSITTGTTSSIMTGDAARGSGWTQQNNISGNTYQLAGGTTFSAIRSNTYATSTLAAIKSGQGNVRVWLGGNVLAGYFVLTGSSGTNTNGNLTVTNDTDYHNILSSIAAGFWQSANISASAGSGIQPGWNTVTIEDLGGYTNGNTNSLMWYNDITGTASGTPTFSNTSITLTTNTVIYSSQIPHFTSGAAFRLKGNVNNLSGDTYSGNTNITSTTGASGAYQAPTAVPISGAVGPLGWNGTVPFPRYLANGQGYGNYPGTVYFETPVSILASGFGNSSAGPTLSVLNSYNTGVSGTNGTSFAPGVQVLYKTGTSTPIDETTIATTTPIGAVSGGSYRIVYSQTTDTPTAITGSESIWSSAAITSGGTPLGLMDATVVGYGTGGRIQFDQTNYSTGYLPVGPNLSGQNSTQYFTMRFAQAGVTTFYLNYSGIVANIFCAMPTSGGVGGTNATNVSNGTYNGWLSAGVLNPGGVPGPGSAGNGSIGCVTGSVPTFGSVVTSGTGSGKMQIYFGTTNSTSAVSNYIYIRFKLTPGQYISALSITAA